MALAFMVEIEAAFGRSVDSEARDLLVAMFRQEGPSLVRLARIFTDDRNAAEDLVQEAFIRFYRNAHRVRDRSRSPSYLRSIVLNLARDHNRRGLLSLRHEQTSVLEPTESVDEQVFRTQSHADLVAALGELSNRQRDCLVLRYYLELSDSEVAETLGISPNSVKTHVRRGLAGLESMLGGRP